MSASPNIFAWHDARAPAAPTVGMPVRGKTDAAKMIGARRDVRLEYRLDARAQPQVGPGDDARRDRAIAVQPARGPSPPCPARIRFRRPASVPRAARAVHGIAVGEHRGHHAVPAEFGKVLEHKVILERRLVVAPVPEMVMGIADGQIGLERLFAHLCQPVAARGHGF